MTPSYAHAILHLENRLDTLLGLHLAHPEQEYAEQLQSLRAAIALLRMSSSSESPAAVTDARNHDHYLLIGALETLFQHRPDALRPVLEIIEDPSPHHLHSLAAAAVILQAIGVRGVPTPITKRIRHLIAQGVKLETTPPSRELRTHFALRTHEDETGHGGLLADRLSQLTHEWVPTITPHLHRAEPAPNTPTERIATYYLDHPILREMGYVPAVFVPVKPKGDDHAVRDAAILRLIRVLDIIFTERLPTTSGMHVAITSRASPHQPLGPTPISHPQQWAVPPDWHHLAPGGITTVLGWTALKDYYPSLQPHHIRTDWDHGRILLTVDGPSIEELRRSEYTHHLHTPAGALWSFVASAKFRGQNPQRKRPEYVLDYRNSTATDSAPVKYHAPDVDE